MDAMFREIVEGVPRRLLEQIIAQKLEKAGVDFDSGLLTRISSHFLSGVSDTFPLNDKDINVIITAGDVAELEKDVHKFIKIELPKLITMLSALQRQKL